MYIQTYKYGKYRVFCSPKCVVRKTRKQMFMDKVEGKTRVRVARRRVPIIFDPTRPDTPTQRYVCGCGGDYARFPLDHICEKPGKP